jgi:intein/homing endonuclease
VANGFICHNCISEDGVLIDARTGEKFTSKQAWEEQKIVSSWTYDESQNKMVVMDNCGVIPQGRRSVYKITSSTGHEIEVTDNHPMLTDRGWIECKDLNTGDRIAITESIPFFGNSNAISEDEAAILGYITGDGCCSQAAVFFTAKNEDIRADFVKAFE